MDKSDRNETTSIETGEKQQKIGVVRGVIAAGICLAAIICCLGILKNSSNHEVEESGVIKSGSIKKMAEELGDSNTPEIVIENCKECKVYSTEGNQMLIATGEIHGAKFEYRAVRTEQPIRDVFGEDKEETGFSYENNWTSARWVENGLKKGFKVNYELGVEDMVEMLKIADLGLNSKAQGYNPPPSDPDDQPPNITEADTQQVALSENQGETSKDGRIKELRVFQTQHFVLAVPVTVGTLQVKEADESIAINIEDISVMILVKDESTGRFKPVTLAGNVFTHKEKQTQYNILCEYAEEIAGSVVER